MQAIGWLTFGISNAVTQTCVHFFPAADAVTAPYPALCNLTLFHKNVGRKSVVLEGGRLGNPDGVWAKDAFPGLTEEGTGLFGMEVDVACSQPRIDVSGSGCVIELASQGLLTRFWPKRRPARQSSQENSAAFRPRSTRDAEISGGESNGAKELNGICIYDPFQTTSIIVVNGSERAVLVLLQSCGEGMAGGLQNGPAEYVAEPIKFEVGAQAVVEYGFGESFYQGGGSQECSWGVLKTRAVAVNFEPAPVPPAGAEMGLPQPASSTTDSLLGASLAAFMVYRESSSGRIVSVVAL